MYNLSSINLEKTWEKLDKKKSRYKKKNITPQKKALAKLQLWKSFLDKTSRYPSGGYEKLSSPQKEIVDQISSQHPDAIKDISETAITIQTLNNKIFNIPLQDNSHKTLEILEESHQLNGGGYEYLKKLPHRYVTYKQVLAYYDAIHQQPPTSQEKASVISLMPWGYVPSTSQEKASAISLMPSEYVPSRLDRDLVESARTNQSFLYAKLMWITNQGTGDMFIHEMKIKIGSDGGKSGFLVWNWRI